MSLNVTTDGYCYLNDGTISSSDVKYQALFFPNGTASSSTTWNNVRVIEATGYFNCNLGDADFLGQEGSALVGSRIIIVFWKGNTTDRNELCTGVNQLEAWGAFEIAVDGSDVYTNVAQVKANIYPVLDWSLPSTGYVDTSYTAVNNSYDVHTWTISGTNMYHWRTRYGENVQLINTVSGTDYDWGDTNTDLGVSGTTNKSHQWTSAGSYDVEIIIYDECSSTVTGTKTIDISWHAPVPDIIMIPPTPDPNEAVFFQWNGTDTDNQLVVINWTINDSGAYGNTNTTISGARDDIIQHSAGIGTDWCGVSASGGAFTNPGNHTVSIIYTWHDGFAWHNDSYNDVFNQARFTGPTVDFTQVPTQAVVASGVKFVNSSTNTSRVGLGLSDCDEYDWTFTDDGVGTNYLDKPYSYELEVTPGSDNCQVELCAWYSDGWDTQQTCVEKDVVFETIITITPEDCYYDLYVIGTSSDGSVSGYSWTIASGTAETGPWTDIWSSPTGMEQQYKSICFTDEGWYNITGYVYGTGATTSDNEALFIDTVCPEGAPTASGITSIIWNGTGVLDLGGDWDRSGHGSEQTYAMRTGTNGLDASGMTKNDFIEFSKSGGDDVSDYDMLIGWINLLSWPSNNTDIEVKFQTLGGVGWNTPLDLSTYIDVSIFNQWQRIAIPLYQFELSSDTVHKLRFTSNGPLGAYFDDIAFGVGVVVPIGTYDMDADEFGLKTQTGHELAISVKADETEPPQPKPDLGDLRPSMKGESGKGPSLKAYPSPINI